MYAIHRYRVSLNAWGWRVSFTRRGKAYFKKFYDTACGGSKKAKAKAVAWRDKRLAELNAFTILEFRQQKRAHNTSGVTGVHLHKTPKQPLGYWRATLRVQGTNRIAAKTFSVRKFGYRGAFRLAVAARTELLAGVTNGPYVCDPLAKRLVRQGR